MGIACALEIHGTSDTRTPLCLIRTPLLLLPEAGSGITYCKMSHRGRRLLRDWGLPVEVPGNREKNDPAIGVMSGSTFSINPLPHSLHVYRPINVVAVRSTMGNSAVQPMFKFVEIEWLWWYLSDDGILVGIILESDAGIIVLCQLLSRWDSRVLTGVVFGNGYSGRDHVRIKITCPTGVLRFPSDVFEET
ncbi:hypothetical protein Tco_0269907 [Tanacetum coccineum]